MLLMSKSLVSQRKHNYTKVTNAFQGNEASQKFLFNLKVREYACKNTSLYNFR